MFHRAAPRLLLAVLHLPLMAEGTRIVANCSEDQETADGAAIQWRLGGVKVMEAEGLGPSHRVLQKR